MRNVAPSRAIVRRSRRLFEAAFVLVSAGIFLAIAGLAFYVVPLTSSSSTSYTVFNVGRGALFVGGVVAGFSGLGLALRAVTQRTENDLALMTGNRLALHLDDRYTFVRNLSRRGLGYIDAVLVGPAGVLVFRVVDYEGAYLNEAGNWLKADRQGNWKPMWFSNPTKDVIDDIKRLREYLGLRGITDVPVFGVVVFTKDDPISVLTLKDPIIPATHLSSLFARLQKNYLAKDRMDPPLIESIVRLLYEA